MVSIYNENIDVSRQGRRGGRVSCVEGTLLLPLPSLIFQGALY